MSIIYEALKKVGESVSLNSGLKPETVSPGPNKNKVYLAIAVVLCVAAAFILLPRLFRRPLAVRPAADLAAQAAEDTGPEQELSLTTATQEPQAVIAEPAPEEVKPPPPSFILNGVFSSEGRDCALINNQIVKEGDNIEGAVVLRIGLEEVELEYKGSAIKLSTKG